MVLNGDFQNTLTVFNQYGVKDIGCLFPKNTIHCLNFLFLFLKYYLK